MRACAGTRPGRGKCYDFPATDRGEKLVNLANGEVLTEKRPPQEMLKKGGEIIHEVGGAIMGSDARRSVLNQYCQSWEVPNLFVTDGAAFVSNADKNPTLSIMAIAWRSSEFLVDEMRKGALG